MQATVTKGAISQARERVGAAPLRQLYREQVHPHGPETMASVWYRGLRLMAIDGSTLDIIEALAHEETIRAHMGLGQQLGVRGTPFFFLGQLGGDDGHVVAHRRIAGAQPLELFRTEIDAALKAQGSLIP